MTESDVCERPGCGQSPVRYRGFCSVDCYNMQGHADDVTVALRAVLSAVQKRSELLDDVLAECKQAPDVLTALADAIASARASHHEPGPESEGYAKKAVALAKRLAACIDQVPAPVAARNLKELQELGRDDGPMLASSGIPRRFARQAETLRASDVAAPEATLARLRASGWRVAIHNDYMLDGVLHTFWGFSRSNQYVKGEGLSDRAALAEVNAAILALPKEAGR